MPKAAVNGIFIEYETIGDPSGRPLLLIGGLATQLIHWDEAVCEDLARRGHYVIRYDNRDTGLSTKCDAADNAERRTGGGKKKLAYTLDDMADDAVGLLDALGIARAHICGTSMGGMIAQTIAIRHPSRLLTLISIYSTAGNKELLPPDPHARDLLLAPVPGEREPHIEHMVNVFRVMTGRGFVFDEEWARTIAARAYDRCFCPAGTARHVNAVMNQPDRRKALASVRVPTLVIHGLDDPLAPVQAGRDTAEAIPGAQLMLIEGMGHDLPHGGAWPQVVEAIAIHTSRAT